MYLPAPDECFYVASLRLSVQVPGARSLKDRRRAVLSFRDRVHARHGAIAAEVGWLEEPTRAVLGVVLAGNDAKLLRSRLDAIVAEADRSGDLLLVEQQADIRPFG